MQSSTAAPEREPEAAENTRARPESSDEAMPPLQPNAQILRQQQATCRRK